MIADKKLKALAAEIRSLEFWTEPELIIAQWIQWHGLNNLKQSQRIKFTRRWLLKFKEFHFSEYRERQSQFIENLKSGCKINLPEAADYLKIAHTTIRWIDELMDENQRIVWVKDMQFGDFDEGLGIRTEERKEILGQLEKLDAEIANLDEADL